MPRLRNNLSPDPESQALTKVVKAGRVPGDLAAAS
jgi:hypothetical protein